MCQSRGAALPVPPEWTTGAEDKRNLTGSDGHLIPLCLGGWSRVSCFYLSIAPVNLTDIKADAVDLQSLAFPKWTDIFEV